MDLCVVVVVVVVVVDHGCCCCCCLLYLSHEVMGEDGERVVFGRACGVECGSEKRKERGRRRCRSAECAAGSV